MAIVACKVYRLKYTPMIRRRESVHFDFHFGCVALAQGIIVRNYEIIIIIKEATLEVVFYIGFVHVALLFKNGVQ